MLHHSANQNSCTAILKRAVKLPIEKPTLGLCAVHEIVMTKEVKGKLRIYKFTWKTTV